MVACAPVPHHSMSDSSGASRILNPAGKLLSVSADLELLRISCKPGNITKMKAISPIRSVRSCYEAVCCISDQSLSITRCRSPTEELSDMNDCYSKLKELVPSIPQNKTVSQMEILQHVIDYIFDLQIALENETDAKNKPDMFMSMKTNEMTCNFSKEDGAMCH